MSWFNQGYRHSLAARGISSSFRKSFALSDWSPEKVGEEAELVKKYVEWEPKTIEGLERKKEVLQDTEKELKDVQLEVKAADIQAMKAELGLAAAGVGALSAATMQGGEVLQGAAGSSGISDRARDSELLNKSDLSGNKFIALSVDSSQVGNPLDKSGDVVREFGNRVVVIGDGSEFQIGGVGKHYPMSDYDDVILRLRAGLWGGE